MLVITLDGAETLLDMLLDGAHFWCHLYTNDEQPDQLSTLDQFVEPDWPAYEPQAIYGWSPAITVDQVAISYADKIVWQRWAGGTALEVYGYYVTRPRNGALVWAEYRSQGPCPMHADTDLCTVFPSLSYVSLFTPLLRASVTSRRKARKR